MGLSLLSTGLFLDIKKSANTAMFTKFFYKKNYVATIYVGLVNGINRQRQIKMFFIDNAGLFIRVKTFDTSLSCHRNLVSVLHKL